MARGFRRKGRGRAASYVARLDPLERATVAGLMDQVHDLLEPPPPTTVGPGSEGQVDEFAAIVAGLGMGVTVAAQDQADLVASGAGRDPALDRLLPTANRQDDEAAAEFRRLTETGLRQRKAAGLALAASLLRAEDKVVLDEASARAFLTALTDVRLVLGERMGLRTDEDLEALEAAAGELDPDDPLGYALAVYDFLTWFQETLASAMLTA
ncbi:DUF2017 domain-containing protein [Ornithinibacter aureus]|uniref:DUF2017 domain-containing protein n=1 Tax=Ornithinibacter aureus TaxID=622664 RepID=A0ABP8K785_9MICO|nr:DUF2017 family protein [Ornithinibacter aureus]KAF0835554.1 uncharacterized protein DUF2017 [Ornithinibacter aureus]